MSGAYTAAARALRTRIRQLSAPRRALPDFLIIGAQKCGTTSLYAYLTGSPGVAAAVRKEVHYFDRNYARGEFWYRSMFPRADRLELTGEASPYYLFHPLVPARAAALVPDARLLVIVRDPVERAWSHYRHEVAAGRESLPFEAALDAEPVRLAGADADVRAGRDTPAAGYHRTASYLARGRYAEQLRAWHAHYPVDALLVLTYEELFTTPHADWQRVCDFLGLAADPPPAFTVHNAGRRAGLPDGMRERLRAEFAQPDQELADLLGSAPPWRRC